MERDPCGAPPYFASFVPSMMVIMSGADDGLIVLRNCGVPQYVQLPLQRLTLLGGIFKHVCLHDPAGLAPQAPLMSMV